jgi:hypothetical protein
MSEVTYVCFVPGEMRGQLRSTLEAGNTGALHWREQKKLFGSEFYFTGPSNLVRQTHAFVVNWVSAAKFRRAVKGR